MDFSQVDAEFRKLKAQYDAGTLSEADFKARLQDLMVQDEQGRWWMIGYESGQWYVHDGEKWVRSEPPILQAKPSVSRLWIGAGIVALVIIMSVIAWFASRGQTVPTPTPPTAAPAAPAASEYKPATDKPMKIAFFVSDMTNVFHQGQATEAQKYAKDKYGAEVFIFDGKSDSATMTANVVQIMAQGMDAASLHIWDYETVKPAVKEALEKGIVLTSFFSPLGDSGIPVARSDEKGVSFAMGAEMAKKWKATYPDKPIVMVQLGWPNHTEVKSGRTDPFVQGVLSVDPTAKDLGCQDASKGADAAKQIIKDLVTQHPEVNLIYSETSNLTVGTMAGLVEAGRGRMKDGKPLTEIVASVDFDESEYKQVYDPNSSLKLSMGLPPLETGRGRIDLIMDVASGKVPMTSQPAQEKFYKAYDISYWSMPQANAAQWLNTQFGTNIK